MNIIISICALVVSGTALLVSIKKDSRNENIYYSKKLSELKLKNSKISCDCMKLTLRLCGIHDCQHDSNILKYILFFKDLSSALESSSTKLQKVNTIPKDSIVQLGTIIDTTSMSFDLMNNLLDNIKVQNLVKFEKSTFAKFDVSTFID